MRIARHAVVALAVTAAWAAGARAADEGVALREKVARLLASGDRSGAVEVAEAAVREKPEAPYSRGCLAWALVESGRGEDALPHAAVAVECFPDDSRFLNNYGCALNAVGRTKEAGDAFRRALAKDARLAAAKNNMGVVFERGGDKESARDMFLQALKLEPNNAAAHNNLGCLLYEEGNGPGAMEEFVAAAKADPAYGSPKINLGALALDRGDNAEAERLLLDASSRPGARSEAHFNLAVLALRKGDLELARTSLEKSLAGRPEDPDILNNLGVCHLLKREFRLAEGYFTRAVKARPQFPQAYDNLGLSFHFLATQPGGDPRLLERSEEAFRKEIAMRPDGAFAHYNLGTVLLARGRTDEAAASFRKAVILAPRHADALTNLGYCLSVDTEARKADPEEEFRCYLRAVEADPECVDAHRSLGFVYGTTGRHFNPEKAIHHWAEYSRLTVGDEKAQAEARDAVDAVKRLQLEEQRKAFRRK